jgi:hypothetical protein
MDDMNFYDGIDNSSESIINIIDARIMGCQLEDVSEDGVRDIITDLNKLKAVFKPSNLDVKEFIKNLIILQPNVFTKDNIKLLKRNLKKLG